MPSCRRIDAALVVLALAVALPVPAAAGDAECQWLTAHRPAPDVEFTPGVDVHGHPVAPADLPGSAGAAPRPDRFEIPVSLAFLRRAGVAVPPSVLPPGTEIGRLVVEGGRLSFNGQPLGGADADRLYALCGPRR
ncbi:hypothetical protein [Azospirillum halopraeferens]|uniref:hypothetical protein n=1 Tax=Azospirillum halopraeferens TaxID=34010 RepID=UPI00048D622A|nr:hypothetical protein [Azospirillum halopraeferens]